MRLLTTLSCLISLVFMTGTALAADIKTPAKPAAGTATAVPVKETKGADAKSVGKEQVDINTASETDLKGIAGIGDAYAAKIVAGRPYAKKDQLKSRNILPAAVYEKVKDQIIARQPPRETKTAPEVKGPGRDARPIDPKKK